MKDVIVVGAGLAGLSAAWRLKHLDLLVLEADNRIGGRVHSERRGNYWLNWGGHLYAGAGSATDELLRSVGIKSVPVPGIMAAMSLNGKNLLGGRVEFYPLRAPMSWSSRFAMVRAGAKVRLSVIKYGKIAKRRPDEDYYTQQQRILDFMSDRTFAEFTGKLPEDADAIFRPTVSRSTGSPETITAGAGVGYFHTVWNKDDGLGRNIPGGPATLTNTIANHLGERVLLNAEVTEVVQKEDYVVITYKKDGVEHVERARYAIITTPAPITKKIAKNLNPELADALGKVVYGPHVSGAFLTNETGPQPWDNIYSMATPKRSFDVLLNQTNVVRATEVERRPGSSFMTFSPGESGKRLLDKSEDEIFPGFKDTVVEARVMKFPYGSAYIYPGREKIQQILTTPDRRIFLAGDYLGTFYTETAVQTGFTAAQHVNSLIEYGTKYAEKEKLMAVSS